MLGLRKLYKPSIYQKVLAGSFIIIVLVIIVGGASYLQLVRFRTISQDTSPISSQLALLQDYAFALSSIEADLERHVLIGGHQIPQSTLDTFAEMSDIVDALETQASDDLLPTVHQLKAETTSLQLETLAVMNMVSRDARSRLINEQLIQVFNQLDRTSEVHRQLSAVTVQQLQTTVQRQDTIVANMTIQQGIVAGAGLILATVASLLVSRSIVSPLLAMVTTATQIAGGDYSRRTRVESKDEVGQLASAFNSMAQAIEERTGELVKAREAADAARKRAEQADLVKSQFLASMSHELRTPLNAILSFNKLMMMGTFGAVSEEQVEYLEKSISSAKHLLSLINDVLDVTKIQSGMMKLFIEEDYDLVKEVNEIAATAEQMLDGKPVTLMTEIESDFPHLVCDKRRVRQVLLNLISNAVKFTKQGTIMLRVRRHGDEVMIAVMDTGPGIPQEQFKIIFEPFVQTETGIKHGGGTGLGLPICKQLVEAHGGRMWLESELGRGTAFFVALPLKAELAINESGI